MAVSKKNTKAKAKSPKRAGLPSVERSWTITADAIAVLEAYKQIKPGNAKNVSAFVSEAIIAHGATVLGNHMPELEGVTECGLPSQLRKIKKELAELRGRLIELELSEQEEEKAVALLNKHKIQSVKQLREAWDKPAVKKAFQAYFPSLKDWKLFIEKHKDDLA